MAQLNHVFIGLCWPKFKHCDFYLKGITNFMMTDDIKNSFYDFAHKGINHIDPNFRIYGQSLYDELRHYERLTQLKAKEKVEEKIRFLARQIEGNQTPHQKI